MPLPVDGMLVQKSKPAWVPNSEGQIQMLLDRCYFSIDGTAVALGELSQSLQKHERQIGFRP